jgi:hypothetical protein
MKIITRVFFILLFSSFVKSNFAQVESIPYYDHLNFNNSFYTIAENDAKSNYYAVNLSVFRSSVEKKYFENLAFGENRLIRIDSGNPDVAWFRVKKLYSADEINVLILQLKDVTINTLAAMSESQKQEWLLRKGK